MKKQLFLVSIVALLGAGKAIAFCASEDGPIVTAGKKAFKTDNVNHALIWIPENKESKIRKLFERAKDTKDPEKRTKKEWTMYEEMVKIHEEEAGGKFEGIDPAGTSQCPMAPIVQQALQKHSPRKLFNYLYDTIKKELQPKFDAVFAAEGFDPNDVVAGRDWANKFVDLMHHLKGIGAAIHNVKE